MGTQKNRLNETVLFSTQNTCLYQWVRKYLKFYANKILLSGPMSRSVIVIRKTMNLSILNKKINMKTGLMRCTEISLVWDVLDI